MMGRNMISPDLGSVYILLLYEGSASCETHPTLIPPVAIPVQPKPRRKQWMQTSRTISQREYAELAAGPLSSLSYLDHMYHVSMYHSGMGRVKAKGLNSS